MTTALKSAEPPRKLSYVQRLKSGYRCDECGAEVLRAVPRGR
jgi:hypothetical protein